MLANDLHICFLMHSQTFMKCFMNVWKKRIKYYSIQSELETIKYYTIQSEHETIKYYTIQLQVQI